jgi:hypothetical protein
MRWTAWLAIAWLGLGCAKTVVTSQNSHPDSGGSGKADAAADTTGQMFLLLDAQPGDVGPVEEDSACHRSVNLRGVSITRPVPFDVVIVADNSDSLSWSRDSLSAGLKNLLARVHGFEARFFVLTTTQYGASSQAAVSPITGKDLVSWRDSVSGAPYLNAVTTYNQECVDGNGAPTTCPKPPHTINDSWKVKGTWQFQMPPPVAEISPAMDDAEIGVQQKRIADAVLALGGGGSQQEQPLCTLLRYIGQSTTALPKHAVFVVLSDEDDTSPPDVCLASYEANQQTGLSSPKVACDSNCPEYVYMSNKPNEEERLEFTCVPVDDKGTAHPERATKKSLVSKIIADCAGAATGACTDAELTKAGVECGAGTVVQSCARTCAVSTGFRQCNLSRPDNKTDICTQPFDQGGVHYANLVDYCTRSTNSPGWGTCDVMGLMPSNADGGTSASYSERMNPLVSVKSPGELIQTFKSNADRLIGKSNYSIEAIVLDPAFTCKLNPGQSYAPNLRTLASSASDVFPLCEDYAPAIERIATFAEYLIQTTYPLDLDAYEAIDSVMVTNKQGVQRTVTATSYSYDRAAKILRFGAGVLTAQDDSLAVNVARYCEIIPIP